MSLLLFCMEERPGHGSVRKRICMGARFIFRKEIRLNHFPYLTNLIEPGRGAKVPRLSACWVGKSDHGISGLRVTTCNSINRALDSQPVLQFLRRRFAGLNVRMKPGARGCIPPILVISSDLVVGTHVYQDLE
jgi:hypothetical protein